MKILSIACFAGLIAIGFAALQAHGEQAGDDMKNYQEIEARLTHLSKSASTQEMAEIGQAISQLSPDKGGQTVGGAVWEKLSLWIMLLGQIDDAIDPSFNLSDPPLRNVAPPSTNGVVYDSGIDPKEIKEPVARKQYEEAIKANQKKAERYERQQNLRRLRDQFSAQIAAYITEQFSGDRRSFVREAIKKEFPGDEKKQARIEALVNKSTDSNQ